MKSQEFLYLSRADVEKTDLPMSRIIQALEEMFLEKALGRTEMPPKPGIHPLSDAFIHAMPAYLPSAKAAGLKWVSGFPQNQSQKLAYINGLIILNDPKTGIPISVMDCTWITGKRTGAATAVSAKYLARPDSSTIGIIACGVQGRDNLEAISKVFKISKVKAFDIYPEVSKNFALEMSEKLAVEIEPVKSAKDAVVGLDMVVTSGPILKNPEPVIEKNWLDEGAFASAVDFDSYWQGEAQMQMDLIVTDDIPQLNYYRQSGYFKKTPNVEIEIGQIVSGKKQGRLSTNQRTLAINLGIALDDMATAILVYKAAIELGIGAQLPL